MVRRESLRRSPRHAKNHVAPHVERPLKVAVSGADTAVVRLERLVIDSGEHTLATDFHPKLTVIGGLNGAVREALAAEVIDSLAGARPGVHLELESRGRSLTVFRPSGGRHRVIDTESVRDVTEDHLGPDGTIDLFATIGVDRALARRTIRLTRDDLVLQGGSDAAIARLAAVDQHLLWAAAERLESAEEKLGDVSAHTGASSADANLVDVVEQRHADLVKATESYERIRLISLTIADVGAIAGLTLAFTDGRSSIPFLALAVAGALLGLFYRRSVSEAQRAERDVLAEAGADSYSAFHLERVSQLLDDDAERRRFMEAVSLRHTAEDGWRELADDIPLTFARDHEPNIRAAAELQRGLDGHHHSAPTGTQIPADLSAELAQALLTRIQAVRALTADGDTLPLVVDDPFEGLDASMKPLLLEMLSASAGDPQLIVLTADADVTSWARVESLTGELAVVEPTLRSSVTA